MALTDNLLTEKSNLVTILESEYNEENLRDDLLIRLLVVKLLSGDVSTQPSTQQSIITSVSTTTSSTLLIGADTTRKGLVISNYSIKSLAIKIGSSGAGFTANNFTIVIPPKTTSVGYISIDSNMGATLPIYGIWDAADATGFANITSLF